MTEADDNKFKFDLNFKLREVVVTIEKINEAGTTVTTQV